MGTPNFGVLNISMSTVSGIKMKTKLDVHVPTLHCQKIVFKKNETFFKKNSFRKKAGENLSLFLPKKRFLKNVLNYMSFDVV